MHISIKFKLTYLVSLDNVGSPVEFEMYVSVWVQSSKFKQAENVN